MRMCRKTVSILTILLVPLFAVKQAYATGILYFKEPSKTSKEETVQDKAVELVSHKRDHKKWGSLKLEIQLREATTLAIDLANIVKQARFYDIPREKKEEIIAFLGLSNKRFLEIMKY